MTDWRPDDMLVPALLAGSRTRMDDLDGCDRAWAVVVMTDDEEMTAEAIAERLDCSLRLVRTILAGPEAVLVRLYRTEAEAFERTLDMTQGEVQRLSAALYETEMERDRLALQRDRLLGVHLAERAGDLHRCGCPVTRYNTYITPKGHRECRTHRKLAVQRHRAKRKGGVASTA